MTCVFLSGNVRDCFRGVRHRYHNATNANILKFSLFQLSIAGESNQTRRIQSEDCSACDPLSNTKLSIDSVLGARAKSEWRSLPKTNDSILQEINITIRFPQVCSIICWLGPFK